METKAFVQREIAPPSHRLWIESQADAFSALEEKYSEWIKRLAQNDKLFERFVYENPEARDLDFRQHRQRLHMLIARGEHLAIEFLVLKGVEDTRPYVDLIDQKIAGLKGALHSWHGPLEDQKDIPSSFKQAVQEGDSRIVPMETALEAPPPARAAG